MIAAAVKHMLAAGMPHDAIVAAISDMEAGLVALPDPVAERRRAYDRERKRIARLSGGSPVESAENADALSLHKERSPRPPKEINPIPRESATRTRGSRLPDDWQPERAAIGTKARDVLDRRGGVWARETLETFTNHWRGKAGRDACKVDWQATWANWVTEQDRRDGRAGNRRTSNGANRQVDGFGLALRRASEFFGPDDDGRVL